MSRNVRGLLIVLAIMAGFWGIISIMRTLINEFSSEVTYIDLGAVFILGFLCGLAVGLYFLSRWVTGIREGQDNYGSES